MKANGVLPGVARASVLFVALQHVGFLVLEMFLWTTPRGLATFGLTAQQAHDSATLAANQGLYNGFLAAGLVWGAFAKKIPLTVRGFFLGCVIVAGVYGGLTAKASIVFVQAAPAALALAFCVLADRSTRAKEGA